MKTPHELADERLKITDQFAKLGERKVELQREFAKYYKQHRDEHKSDAGLERAWELTDEGLELMEIKEKMKAKTHRISAIRTKLEVANLESFNQY